jgi:uncharacterized protein YegJ (DUF2314 family)
MKALSAALLLAILASAVGPAVSKDKVVQVSDSNRDMKAAIRKAQDTLDSFLAIAAAPPAGTDGYKLKVAISDGKNTEHFWLTPFRVTRNGFEGILANEPNLVHTYKPGQTVSFARKDISDWGYQKNGRQVGSFTVCALFKSMPAADVAYYRTNHGFDC